MPLRGGFYDKMIIKIGELKVVKMEIIEFCYLKIYTEFGLNEQLIKSKST